MNLLSATKRMRLSFRDLPAWTPIIGSPAMYLCLGVQKNKKKAAAVATRQRVTISLIWARESLRWSNWCTACPNEVSDSQTEDILLAGSDDMPWKTMIKSAANQFAMDQFLELNSALQHPTVIASMMVKGGVKPGIALQFVSNIKRFQQEAKKP